MKFTPNPVDTLPAPEIPEDPIAPGEDPRKLCIKLGGAITRYWDTVWEDQKIQAAAEAERLCRTMGRDDEAEEWRLKRKRWTTGQ